MTLKSQRVLSIRFMSNEISFNCKLKLLIMISNDEILDSLDFLLKPKNLLNLTKLFVEPLLLATGKDVFLSGISTEDFCLILNQEQCFATLSKRYKGIYIHKSLNLPRRLSSCHFKNCATNAPTEESRKFRMFRQILCL